MRTTQVLIPIVVALAAAAGGYWAGKHGSSGKEHAQPTASTSAAPNSERRILYWHDPMYPQHRFDKPGKSPFMDMQLVPVYADAQADAARGASVSARAVQNLGVRYAEAVSGSLEPRMEAVGTVGWNERGVVVVQTRAAGFVERLHARAALDPVAKGAPLVEILFPDWAAAQEDLLLAQRLSSPDAESLKRAAHQRLTLLGMSEAEIGEVERSGAVKSRFTLHAPISGVIAELGVREGMTVMAGATLFRIVDLSTVWVTAEVPEAQSAWLKPGAPVEARVPAWPGDAFKGRVGAILPEVNSTTRTLRARIELANPGARLKPGMFANLSVSMGRGRDVVLVPSEAVIRTGERNVVIVADGGRFMPLTVEVGQEAGGRSEILKGLEAGARVVASGQFLIDSEASLKAGIARLQGSDEPAAPATRQPLHKGSGRIIELDAAQRRVKLDHAPVPSLKWPSMTMGFVVSDPKALAGLKSGDAVEFEFRGEADKDGNYVIDRIGKKGAP
jgi:Cu(I)/Ag(I) efflux system membrane fusion protein